MDPVLLKVQRLLCEHFTLTAEQVLPDQGLADLGIDSLAAIEFLFILEDEFAISLSDQRGDLQTIADIVILVENSLSAKGATA